MPRKKQISEQEIRRKNLEFELKQLLDTISFCSEPTYKFNIGDLVSIGNLKNPIVTEILADGKIYKICYSVIHNNYGNPYEESGLEKYVFWHEIRPINTAKETIVQNKDIRLNFNSVSIGSILNSYYHFGIDMNPDYQRDYVWNLSDKQKLVDSIFQNIDIGKFVLVHRGYHYDKMYEVLDGKQRINCIVEYYENRFPYKNKYYNDLSIRDQDFFVNFSIAEAIVEDCTRKEILHYFLMLNTSGRHMDKKHMENIKKLYKTL